MFEVRFEQQVDSLAFDIRSRLLSKVRPQTHSRSAREHARSLPSDGTSCESDAPHSFRRPRPALLY